jgi:hypothetical protein
VSFAVITICVASQRVFIVVGAIFRYRLSPQTFGHTNDFQETFTRNVMLKLKLQFNYILSPNAFNTDRKNADESEFLRQPLPPRTKSSSLPH